jgi:phospho-N-acetylmuramoyl-pentapeptide-transferase
MLKEFLYPLADRFAALNVFQYITFRAAYAAVTALCVSFLLGPAMIARLQAMKAGQVIRPDGPNSHQAKKGTPSMGGLLILASVVVSVLLWQDIHSVYTWLTILAVVGFGAIGFLDDVLKLYRKDSVGLRAGLKFSGQILVAAAIVLFLYLRGGEYVTELYIPFLKNPVVDLSFLYVPFGILLLVGSSNAVNLTDGLDGLASGLVILVGITFAVMTYLSGRVDYAEYLLIPYIAEAGELTILCTALVGACVGFLWYNAHPAEVFMGDTGSLSLGGVIGVIALIIKKEIVLAIVGGVFVMEVVSVILQVIRFKTTGKRVFLMAPIHHHFELSGWKESKVVIRFWILGGLFAIIGLSTLKLQ